MNSIVSQAVTWPCLSTKHCAIRETEAEFAEDETAWIPMSLMKDCADAVLEIKETNRSQSFWAIHLAPATLS